MARIIGGLTTSHVPAIGGAIAKGIQQEPYWKPFFDGYLPVHRWLADVKPDVAVVFYNDDYTTKWFVVMVLERFFRMDETTATAFMMAVHNEGKGAAGVYTRDIAETKATQVMDFARKQQHPLQCVMEKK